MNCEPSGNINYTAHEGHLLLDFRVLDNGEVEWTPVTQTVRFDYTSALISVASANGLFARVATAVAGFCMVVGGSIAASAIA